MADYEIQEYEFSLDDLIGNMKENVKEDMKSFEDLVNLDGSLKRELYLFEISSGTGSTIDGYIRFWNEYDNERNIPIEQRIPIKIYIDSCGGSLTDTFTIIDAIKLSKTPVWTINLGCAYSGGFFVFICGHKRIVSSLCRVFVRCGHKRIAYPHASFLFHEGSTGTSGTSSQFENYTAFYKRQLEQLKNIVLENTSISQEEYQDIKKDDIWYDVKDGIEKGFIDEVAKELI